MITILLIGAVVLAGCVLFDVADWGKRRRK